MEKKGVGRPRDGNPEETRREILRAATDAFAASGFAGATTRAIAARAGVNVATLHYHFGSKEGLYRASLAGASHGPLPEVAGGEGDVGRLVEALFAFGAERPALARLALLDALAGPPSDGGDTADARVSWLAGALRSVVAPPGRAEGSARAIVRLVDAAFLAEAGPAGPGAEGNGGPTTLPDAEVRGAVLEAARRLTARVASPSA